MRFGLGVLRLAPRAFWTTTPRELHAAAEGLFGPRDGIAPSRQKLEDLMRSFPDG
ncbi:MAG: phage tail assembly chaperone [Rhodoblastus sp.]|nr:phage tail assembly chaperone [Rhodoblastus sp.]